MSLLSTAITIRYILIFAFSLALKTTAIRENARFILSVLKIQTKKNVDCALSLNFWF